MTIHHCNSLAVSYLRKDFGFSWPAIHSYLRGSNIVPYLPAFDSPRVKEFHSQQMCDVHIQTQTQQKLLSGQDLDAEITEDINNKFTTDATSWTRHTIWDRRKSIGRISLQSCSYISRRLGRPSQKLSDRHHTLSFIKRASECITPVGRSLCGAEYRGKCQLLNWDLLAFNLAKEMGKERNCKEEEQRYKGRDWMK